ncbi:MAG: hypothetical protein FJ147_16735 [Deltaproteobacteria bacterium]|nr:hypothetical protein [Deltaproteobacteria bacterium]
MSFTFYVLRFTFHVLRVAFRFPSLRGVFSPIRPFAHSPILFFLVPCSLFPVTFLTACGHKTPVRPPEWIVPEAIGDLALDIDNNKKIVVLKWGRPQEYVDGSEMDDLGGFVVLRATEGERGQDSGFAQVATITVTDRDRFRKAKQFSYTDTQLTAGVLYRYRVQAVTLDGYASAASNTVELVWKDTPPATATPTPAPTKR